MHQTQALRQVLQIFLFVVVEQKVGKHEIRAGLDDPSAKQNNNIVSKTVNGGIGNSIVEFSFIITQLKDVYNQGYALEDIADNWYNSVWSKFVALKTSVFIESTKEKPFTKVS